MNKRFSLLSSILVIIGPLLLITTLYFGVPSFGVLFLIFFIVSGLYIAGVILGIMAFKRREKGFLKYVSVISVIIAVIVIGILN